MIQPQTTVNSNLSVSMIDTDTVFEPHGRSDSLSSLPLQFDRQTRAIGDLFSKRAVLVRQISDKAERKAGDPAERGAGQSPRSGITAKMIEAQQGLFSAGVELLAAQAELMGKAASLGGWQMLTHYPASMMALVEQFQGAMSQKRSPS
ncbi:hypothetical protein [Sphingobium bisphenolivorans]|uniref:hypothetical protein n=1 Tax=Sphingobium bisphenolivorans TaxID=1335760 RepID=UPI0003A949E0|nr:hypothetical protein [Sphingobium bisphenolivorans]